MSVPFIPLYVTDYEADTAHLSLEEDGAYLRLLRLCWRTPGCSIPDDRDWITRRMRCSAEEYERIVEPLLNEFFKRRSGRLFNPRLSAEFERIDATHRARSSAGKKGGRPAKALKEPDLDESPGKAKRKQDDFSAKPDVEAGTVEKVARPDNPLKTDDLTKSPGKAKRKQLEPYLEPYLDREKGEPIGSPKKPTKGSRLTSEWVLPKSWGEWAVSLGASEALVRKEADRFRDYWIAVPGQKGVKLDWEATWRNWMRRSLESAPAAAPQNEAQRMMAARQARREQEELRRKYS